MKVFPNIGVAAAAITITALFGIGSTSHAETTVVVGYQQIVGPFVAAIAEGSFNKPLKEAGYTVDWRQFTSGGDISTALASGNVPIGVIGSTGIAAASSRGVELKLFWILDNIGKSEALVVRNGSGISKPDDLKGKNVGVPFMSTSHFHLLIGLQKVWKVDPRGVNILNMQPPQIVAAWQRGDIDAAYVWPPALSAIAKTGKVLTDSEQIGAASVPTFDGLIADQGWAKQNPKFMEAFTKVLAQTYADYNANAAKWTPDSPQVKGIVKMIGGTPEDASDALKLLLFPTAQEQASEKWLGGGANGGAVRALTESAKFLAAQKQIDQVLDDYSPYVDGSYAQQAAKALEAAK
jgi:taurine transport system substrate-binding protein